MYFTLSFLPSFLCVHGFGFELLLSKGQKSSCSEIGTSTVLLYLWIERQPEFELGFL